MIEFGLPEMAFYAYKGPGLIDSLISAMALYTCLQGSYLDQTIKHIEKIEWK